MPGVLSLELPPPPLLKPYVHLIWCFELDADGDPGPPERIAPDGIVELVFHYRDPMRMRFTGEDFVAQPRTLVVSQTRRYLEFLPGGTTGLLSVRFRPWGAYHFLGMPISEIADQLVAAEDLWGEPVRELEERLGEAGSMADRLSLVEGFLLDRLRRHQKAEVETLVRAVWRRNGQVRVPELCRELGLGERSCQRIFAATLGMPPKSFARLTRFLHACSQLQRGHWTHLTHLAHDCGYYDQAHFIADCRAFSGMTPSQLVAARGFSFLEIG